MEARIGKWGNSLALRIPRALAARMGLELDSAVELIARNDELVIAPVKPPETELDLLLAGVTESNLHAEIDTGPAVGGESW